MAHKVKMIGGRQDGNEITVESPLQLGEELKIPLRNEPSRSEVYRMEIDGCLHFNRFGLAPPIIPKGWTVPKEAKEIEEALKPLLRRLSECFRETGGVLPEMRLEGWILKPDEGQA